MNASRCDLSCTRAGRICIISPHSVCCVEAAFPLFWCSHTLNCPESLDSSADSMLHRNCGTHRERPHSALAVALATCPCSVSLCGAVGEVRHAHVLVPDVVPLVHLHGLPKLWLRFCNTPALSPCKRVFLYLLIQCPVKSRTHPEALHAYAEPLHPSPSHTLATSTHLLLCSMQIVMPTLFLIPQHLMHFPASCLHTSNFQSGCSGQMSHIATYISIWHDVKRI